MLEEEGEDGVQGYQASDRGREEGAVEEGAAPC